MRDLILVPLVVAFVALEVWGCRRTSDLKGGHEAMAETDPLGAIGTVLGIVCNLRDELAWHRLDLDDFDTEGEIAELERAIVLLKPMVLSSDEGGLSNG